MSNYGSELGVSALVPAVGTLDVLSTPQFAHVTQWLDEGAGFINAVLRTAGFQIPAPAGIALYPALIALNDLYGAAYVLRSRGMDIVEGKEEARSEMYLKDFFRRLALLAMQDLTDSGLIPIAPLRRRGIRTLQLRRVDGYSQAVEGIEVAGE